MLAAFAQPDAEVLYAQMRPDQRTAIALEFARCLDLAGDPIAKELLAEAKEVRAADENIVVVGGGELVAPRLLTAQQAAAVHHYVFEHHHECFTLIMGHPVTLAVLGSAEDTRPAP